MSADPCGCTASRVDEELQLLRAEIACLRSAVERAADGVPWALTYERAATLLDTSKRTIERLVKAGRLRPKDIGGPKIPANQIRALLEERRRPANVSALARPRLRAFSDSDDVARGRAALRALGAQRART